jgi:hypothetical protein
MMDWSAAVASNALLSSIFLAVALFVVLGLLFGYGWRTGAVVVVVVVGVNVFCEGGAPWVIATVLRPFHTLATTGHPPEPPPDQPSHWPNG